MEIERKFTIKRLPADLESYPFRRIEQGYLNTSPVAREESNLPLTREAYCHLKEKADGRIISKKRYLIPLLHPEFQEREGFPCPPADYSLTIELDVFAPPLAPLIMAEVEFGSREAAEAFIPPDWFDEDVTYRPEYHNSYMALQP